jgi:hypothetical protein
MPELLFVCHQLWIVYTDFHVKCSLTFFTEIRERQPRWCMLRTGGRTDMTKLIDAFRDYANALKIREKTFLKLCVYNRGTKNCVFITGGTKKLLLYFFSSYACNQASCSLEQWLWRKSEVNLGSLFLFHISVQDVRIICFSRPECCWQLWKRVTCLQQVEIKWQKWMKRKRGTIYRDTQHGLCSQKERMCTIHVSRWMVSVEHV